MALTRKCEACNITIARPHYIELQMRVMKTEGDQYQSEIEQTYGDYCDGCIQDGCAVADLMTGLKKTYGQTKPKPTRSRAKRTAR